MLRVWVWIVPDEQPAGIGNVAKQKQSAAELAAPWPPEKLNLFVPFLDV